MTPLENISKYHDLKETHVVDLNNYHTPQNELTLANTNSEKLDESSELLSRTLKRKFTELDEITRRLRLRLSNVTNDESDASNDDLADEFERDINTLCVEDDYDMINLQIETDEFNIRPDIGIGLLQLQDDESETKKNVLDSETADERENASSVSLSEKLDVDTKNSLSSLDKHLVLGKQRIDTLLEKLSLLSASENASTFENRYVSGCSASNRETSEQTADILKELGIDSVQLNTEALFSSEMFQQIYAGNSGSESSPILVDSCSSSSTGTLKSVGACASDFSLAGKLPDRRMAPDGEGDVAEDMTVQSKKTP